MICKISSIAKLMFLSFGLSMCVLVDAKQQTDYIDCTGGKLTHATFYVICTTHGWASLTKSSNPCTGIIYICDNSGNCHSASILPSILPVSNCGGYSGFINGNIVNELHFGMPDEDINQIKNGACQYRKC